MVVAEYQDEARSAFHGNRGDGLAEAKRRAVEEATAAGSAELWVQHSDRLARGDGLTADHLGEIWFALRRAGVRLRSVQDDGNLEDALRAVLIGERNHEDSARKSAATRSGKRRRFEAGHTNASLHDGYRLSPRVDAKGAAIVERSGKLVYDRELCPERAPIFERIFAMVETGTSCGDVARTLNREGMLTMRGKQWTLKRIRDTVQDPYYAGLIRGYDGELRDGVHPPLIERDRWERIQASLTRLDPAAVQRRNGGRKPKTFFLLRGLVFCGRCGLPMYCRENRAGRVYVCKAVRQCQGTCAAPSIRADVAEAEAVGHLHHFVGDLVELARAAHRRTPRRGQDAGARRGRRAHAGRRAGSAARADDGRLPLADRQGASTARLALEEAERVETQIAEQSQRVAEAEARVAEWTADAPTDSVIDAYHELQQFVLGRLSSAAAAQDIADALHALLEGVTMEVNARGVLELTFTLRQTDAVLAGDLPQSVRVVRARACEPATYGPPEGLAPKLVGARG